MALAAIGQICSTASVTHNLEQCLTLLRQAAAAGAKILFLPEAADYIAASPEQALALAQPMDQSPFVLGLQAAARQHAVAVHVGIHVPVAVQAAASGSNPVLPTVPATGAAAAAAGGGGGGVTKLLNRTIYIDAAGRLDAAATAYDKLHLFDYAAAGLRESAQTQAGTALVPPFATPVGRLGSLTCFDMRFPEPSLALASGWKTTNSNSNSSSTAAAATAPAASDVVAPAHVIVYPSAFTVPTGRAHWEVLLRARAIESQCWVVAAAQVGRHNKQRVSYGNSLAIDPWGKVVCRLGGVVGGADEAAEQAAGSRFGEAEAGAAGQLGLVDIDLDAWTRVRERMPLVRRTDVYPAMVPLPHNDTDGTAA